MGWKIEKSEATRYKRNALKQVVCQIVFQPILKIQKDVGIEDFQDLIRARFPEYQSEKVRSIKINAADPGDVEIGEMSVHKFVRPDDVSSLQLAADTVSIEYQKHNNHEPILADVALALDALQKVYGSVSIKRLGLRYINVVDKAQLEKDLSEELEWSDLIEQQFLLVPHEVVDLDDSRFLNEITGKFDPGYLTLKYGILADKAAEGRNTFRFDIDRYETGALKTDEIENKIKNFVHDTYSVFALAMGDKLKKWMEPLQPQARR